MHLGRLHLVILHLPIALIVATAVADLLGLKWRGGFFRQAGMYCLLFAAVTAVPTAILGDMLLDELNPTGEKANLAETHESLGVATACVAGAALLLRAWRRNNLAGRWGWTYAVLIVAAVALVSLAGHWGGMLAFKPDYLKLW